MTARQEAGRQLEAAYRATGGGRRSVCASGNLQRQTGQVSWSCSHDVMHVLQKSWAHGSAVSARPGAILSMQMLHALDESARPARRWGGRAAAAAGRSDGRGEGRGAGGVTVAAGWQARPVGTENVAYYGRAVVVRAHSTCALSGLICILMMAMTGWQAVIQAPHGFSSVIAAGRYQSGAWCEHAHLPQPQLGAGARPVTPRPQLRQRQQWPQWRGKSGKGGLVGAAAAAVVPHLRQACQDRCFDAPLCVVGVQLH